MDPKRQYHYISIIFLGVIIHKRIKRSAEHVISASPDTSMLSLYPGMYIVFVSI